MNGTPEPALQPLHPDKPEPPIVAGEVWIKKASGKTTQNAPRCRVLSFNPKLRAGVCVTHIWNGRDGNIQDFTERTFRRDWRPC